MRLPAARDAAAAGDAAGPAAEDSEPAQTAG
jgi:hypothetical protein